MQDNTGPFKEHDHQEMEEEEKLWHDIYQEIPLLAQRIEKALTLHNQSFHGDDIHSIEFYQCQFIQDMLQEFNSSISLLQGKYTIEILFVLYTMEKPYFNQIKQALPHINSNTLSTRLKSLEQEKLVRRTVMQSTPVRVSYALTSHGKMSYLLLYPLFLYSHGLAKHNIEGPEEDDEQPQVNSQD